MKSGYRCKREVIYRDKLTTSDAAIAPSQTWVLLSHQTTGLLVVSKFVANFSFFKLRCVYMICMALVMWFYEMFSLVWFMFLGLPNKLCRLLLVAFICLAC